MRILWWKWRKYPIKRDEDGRSLRQQAFALFNKKLRPSEIYKQQLVQASQKTLFRYYEDWKKERNQVSYRAIRNILKNNPDFTEKLIETLSKNLEMPVEEVKRRLGEPWGLKQALRGQLPDYRLAREQSEIEYRLDDALAMINIMELFGHSPEQLADLLVQITTLTDGAKLEITREERKLIVKKEAKGKSTTIELDYLNQ